MESYDISTELWREYEWFDPVTNCERSYRIVNPKRLWVGKTTHRVEGHDGVVHCIPSVGQLGCVLRWLPRDPNNPVQF